MPIQPAYRKLNPMRGIISAAGYVPYRRLQRSAITDFFGSGGGRGTRSVASYDEDTTTMGVEAARLALRAAAGVEPAALWFATADPAYLEKTNATAIHAALRLDRTCPAVDTGGAVRSGVGSLRAALESTRPVLVVASDVRAGLPTSADESGGSTYIWRRAALSASTSAAATGAASLVLVISTRTSLTTTLGLRRPKKRAKSSNSGSKRSIGA